MIFFDRTVVIYRMECLLVLSAAVNWQCSRWCRSRCHGNWWTLCHQLWTSTTPVAVTRHNSFMRLSQSAAYSNSTSHPGKGSFIHFVSYLH